MKKVLIVLAAAALCASCANPTKCKCSVELNLGDANLSAKEQIIEKPEDTKCADIRVEDIKGELGSLNLSKVAKVKCTNYYE